MPRIRSLKIGFFTNESLCDLSPWHRLLFAGLWLLADREGRLEDRPRRIKAELFPYDEIDVNALLADLAEKGFVVRYGVGDARYLAIPFFLKHQRPNKREGDSLIPGPEGGTCTHVQDRVEGSLGDGLGNGLGEGDGDAPTVQTRAEDLMQAWNETTHPPIASCRELTDKRRAHCRARLREAALPEWREIFARIQASRFCRGEIHRNENHANWKATFDWVIGSADVRVKVLEGKYDDGKPAAPKPTVHASQIGKRGVVPMGIQDV